MQLPIHFNALNCGLPQAYCPDNLDIVSDMDFPSDNLSGHHHTAPFEFKNVFYSHEKMIPGSKRRDDSFDRFQNTLWINDTWCGSLLGFPEFGVG